MSEATLDNLVQTPGGHEDHRRKITDVTPRVKAFVVKNSPDLLLGNHYHAKMEELFYAVVGSFEIKFEDIRTHEMRTYKVEPGESVRVPIYVAHLLIPDPSARFLNIMKTDFEKSDLYPYKIEW